MTALRGRTKDRSQVMQPNFPEPKTGQIWLFFGFSQSWVLFPLRIVAAAEWRDAARRLYSGFLLSGTRSAASCTHACACRAVMRRRTRQVAGDNNSLRSSPLSPFLPLAKAPKVAAVRFSRSLYAFLPATTRQNKSSCLFGGCHDSLNGLIVYGVGRVGISPPPHSTHHLQPIISLSATHAAGGSVSAHHFRTVRSRA